VGCGARRSVCALLVLGFLFHGSGEEVGGQRSLSCGEGENHSVGSHSCAREEREGAALLERREGGACVVFLGL
jgi:hypothetical protein